MIRLDVSKYCSNCPGFEPIVEKNVLRGDGGIKMVNTVVTCKNSARCRNIYSYIRNECENDIQILHDHEIL